MKQVIFDHFKMKSLCCEHFGSSVARQTWIEMDEIENKKDRNK